MEMAERRFPGNIDFSNIPKNHVETFIQMERLYMLYDCAIRETRTKLENLDHEMKFVKERNPIQHITSRLKNPRSIIEKMNRYGLESSAKNIWDNITDVAALRVICSYIEDIYAVADMLKKQDDVFVLKEKDYIKHPKESGYRSLHLIVETPVFLSDEKVMVKVEVQIRTIAMDFWSSLEHQLRYKTAANVPDDIRKQLKDCAERVYGLDMEMEQIYKKIESVDP